MRWTNEAPRQEHAGHFFWMKVSDNPPEVVRIEKWSGKGTSYHSTDGTAWIAHHPNPTKLMADTLKLTMWAGPILPPESDDD